MRLGIDFGTTRTVVACADRGNYPLLAFVDDAGDSHDFIPSIVAEKDGGLRFGLDALALQGPAGDDDGSQAGRGAAVVRSFKRLLSGPRTSSRVVEIGAVTIGLDELVTRFLSAVREAILTRSTLAAELDGKGARAIEASVVAVPANASSGQRLVTLDAFRRAGLEPIAMLNEPSAAGFEYTHRHRSTLTSKRDHVVVYDLGGGTFDASLVRMRGRSHEVLAAAGVNELGGDDFDEVILDLVLARAKLDKGDLDPRALARLRDQCRDAKERLNPSSRKLSVDLEAALGEREAREITVPVAEIYEACTPLVEASIEAMLPVMSRLEEGEARSMPIEQGGVEGRSPPTMRLDVEARDEDAGPDSLPAESSAPTRDDIAGIYVVGGASELPIVGRVLRQRFGRRVHRSPYASGAIAIGLAIACDEAAGFDLVDRFARTFGVFREGQAGSEITFDPIFTPDTILPARGAAAAGPALFVRRYRAAHNVGHYRFLECSAVDDDGKPRGHTVLSGDVLFPFEPALEGRDLSQVRVERIDGARPGPQVEERYVLDENGIVTATIKNLDGGFERVFQLGA